MTAAKTLVISAIILVVISATSAAPTPTRAAATSEIEAGSDLPEATQSLGGLMVEVVIPEISQPTDFAFAPDGRIFIASLDGIVHIAEDGRLLPAPFITLPTNSDGQRGLLGLALDPEFEENGYVYLFHTYENNPDDPEGPKTNQLIRVTADGNVAVPGSELVLLGGVVGSPSQPSCGEFPVSADCLPADGKSHVGGSLQFATDGTLFVGTGDGSFLAPNEGELQVLAQNLDSLAGKLLRINRDGSAPPDNPFFTGDPNANRSKVWAYGLRNPFRLSLQPGTDVPFVGDVGSGFWEEINAVQPGANLGWPCYEGANRRNSLLPFCDEMYKSRTTFSHAVYNSGRTTAFGTAIVAGVFYQGGDYPLGLQDGFFFGDWVQHTIIVLRVDVNNEVIAGSVAELFRGQEVGSPVDFELHPDGDVYFLSWTRTTLFGDLRRIHFVAGNQAPTAAASAVPKGGLAQLDVQFSSEGSTDPDGDALLFSWDFGDGASSSDAHPMHSFTEDGRYDVTLLVTDSEGAGSSDAVSIIVGDVAPTVSITTPGEGDRFTVGEVMSFSGAGSDHEDGALPADNLDWSIDLHHCEDAGRDRCHTHGFLVKTGNEGTFIGPDPGDDVYFIELRLTATDSAGLTDSTSILIGPGLAADDDTGGTSLVLPLIALGALAAVTIAGVGAVLARRRFFGQRS